MKIVSASTGWEADGNKGNGNKTADEGNGFDQPTHTLLVLFLLCEGSVHKILFAFLFYFLYKSKTIPKTQHIDNQNDNLF